jgi:putative methyltransferase (TIGR04325 family)
MITVRDFIPPVAGKLRDKFRSRTPLPVEDETFSDYQTAASRCGGGWDDGELARWIARDAGLIRQRAFAEPAVLPVLEMRAVASIGWIVANRPPRERLTVLDFGGSAGFNYFAVKSLFRDQRFDWCVVETKATVAASAFLSDDELRFAEDIDAAARPDLVLSSGALQYHPRPLLLLERLIALGAPYLVLFRTTMSDGSDTFYAVQRASLAQHLHAGFPEEAADVAVHYPITFVPRAEVRRLLERDYRIVAEMDEGVLNRIGTRAVHGYGMFCTRRRQ